MRKQTKKKLKLKKSVIFKGISFILILGSILIFGMFLKMDVLPFKYLVLLFCLLGLIDVILYFCMSRKNYQCRMIGSVLSVILVFSFAFILHYQSRTLEFMKKITFLNLQTESYEVVVLNDSRYQELLHLTSKTIGYNHDRKGVQKAINQLNKEFSLKNQNAENLSDLVELLFQKQVEAILVEKAELDVYFEMSPETKEKVRILDTVEVEVERENVVKDIKIAKEPFNLYVTGIDTYGKLSNVSRSDVNMLITVNPLTHKILLTSIPRDYYVQVYGTSNLKDKLTHAGLKGVDTSMKTIEELLQTEIPYYVRINFTSLTKIVDAIDGVDVDNPFEFTADYQEEEEAIYYVFPKGNIHLNGKQALAYVRERYGLREGDIARARHQQEVISALVKKVSAATILAKYTKILGSIEGNFDTNVPLSSITGFIEKQMDDGIPSWTIENLVLNGSDSYEHTAAFPDLYSWVLIPDEEQLEKATEKINAVLEER